MPANMQYFIRDLREAYSRASSLFKTQLCKLNGVYITEAKWSWGFRNINNKNRYIAISKTLWVCSDADLTNCASIPFVSNDKHDYTNIALSALFSFVNDSNPPSYTSYIGPNPNNGADLLLAALAHEVGHILWNDILIDPTGSAPNFDKFCPGIFPTASWVPYPPSPKRWRDFGETEDNPIDWGDDPSSPPPSGDPGLAELRIDHIKALLGSTQPQKINRAHKIMIRLLAPRRPWPSLLGAFSINEDFVETFTLYTLNRAGLKSLVLSVPVSGVTTPIDVPGTITSCPFLSGKLLCFDYWFATHPP